MSRTVIASTHRRFSFSRTHRPVATVRSGAEVTFETTDAAYARLFEGVPLEDIGLERFNPVTGPLAVEGAQPGDVLHIDVLDIEICRAWAVWVRGFGVLGDRALRTEIRAVPLRDGRLILGDRLEVPMSPAIGCVGLAPARGESSTLSPAYEWGGNMDLVELGVGARLSLPVQTEGAFLSVGDLHAAMGSGEPTLISIEAAGAVTVRVEVEKGRAIEGPRLRVGDSTLLAAFGQTIEEAQEVALERAFSFLVREWGLEPFEAHAYCCARVGMRFGGPAKPMVLVEVPDPRG